MIIDRRIAVGPHHQDTVGRVHPLLEPEHLAVAVQEVLLEVEARELAEHGAQVLGETRDAVVREVELRQVRQVPEVLRLDVREPAEKTTHQDECT